MSKTGRNQSAKALEDFISEAQDILENLGRDLMVLDKTPEGREKNPDSVNNLFRGIHTLKSLSGMFGVEHLMNLAHREETLLEEIRLGRTPLDRKAMDLLFESLEVITRALSKIVPGGEIEDQATVDSLAAFTARLAAANGEVPNVSVGPRPSLDPMKLIGEEVMEVLTEYEEHRLKTNIKRGLPVFSIGMKFDLDSIDVNLEDVRQRLRSVGEIITYLPSSDDSDHDKLGINIIMVLSENREVLDTALKGIDADIKEIVPASEQLQKPNTLPPPPEEKKSEEKQQLSEEEKPVSSRVTVPPPAPMPVHKTEEQSLSLRSVSQTVRVDIKKLDNLMNVVGELAVVRAGIARMSDKVSRLIGRSDLTIELDQLNRGLDRRLSALREGILEVRMVPLNQMFDRLARMVRKISMELGKEIHFVMSGADTEVDKLITEELSDPLMHLIRNSIDHGVESPNIRLDEGKPEYGTVALTAYQKGSHVVIEVEDDGAGINSERLVEAAIKRGVIDEDQASTMTPREIMDLIFIPGVSTSRKTTEISGRGVGMDIVKTNISALGGVIEVQSSIRIGTKFTVTLPITLATIPALLTSVSERTYAVPLNTVSEALLVPANDIKMMIGNETVAVRNETLVLCRLSEFFGTSEKQVVSRNEVCVVVVSMGRQKLGLVVDALHSQQDVVVKPLGAGIRDMTCFSGAADVGEERLALVIDVSQVIQQFFYQQEGAEQRSLLTVRS